MMVFSYAHVGFSHQIRPKKNLTCIFLLKSFFTTKIHCCGAIIDNISHAPIFLEDKDKETKNSLNNILRYS